MSVGQRTLLDVLNAERDLVQAEVDLAGTQRDRVLFAYALLQAMGRLETAGLGAVDLAYDPTMHYHEVRRKWWGISITRPGGTTDVYDLWKSHGERREAEVSK